MKRVILIFELLFAFNLINAQVPRKMSYQAIVRNSNSELVVEKTIGMQISIIMGNLDGLAVYVETQTPTTNSNGMISIEVGGGTVVSGNFTNIDWSSGTYYVKTETDLEGGINYTITGTQQILTVPYSFYSDKSGYSEISGYSETTASTFKNKMLYTKMILVYDEVSGNYDEAFEFWIANIDGTGSQKIPINLPAGKELKDIGYLTPDGQKLLFVCEDEEGKGDMNYIYSVSVNGNNLVKIFEVTTEHLGLLQLY